MTLKEFIIDWNNRFPFDSIYRKKYNIAFNSQAHRSLSQIDIYFDIIEDKLFSQYYEKYKRAKELEEDYKKTKVFLLESKHVHKELSEEEFDDLFKKLDVKQFNKKEDGSATE